MGLINFYKLPVNTLVGADWHTFQRITKGRKVEKGWRTKYVLTKSICRLMSLFTPIQQRRYRKLLEQGILSDEPVFILGHWRSGTTFLHNVLCCDETFGYCTTYQTVFPHLVMFGQPFFKRVMNWIMPDRRPTDGLELAPDLPQEEEFALSNLMPESYYHWWYFPQDEEEMARRFLLMDDLTDEECHEWQTKFRQLVNISLWNTGGQQFLSKNPPHTARIREILKVYPKAKFIYLVRNPYTVFESSRNYFTKTLIPLKLHNYSEADVEQQVLRTYKLMYERYERDKTLIPAKHLVEVRFEDFEADPMGELARIYNKLRLPGFNAARRRMETYVLSRSGHQKRKYSYDDRTIRLVKEHWQDAITQWGYDEAHGQD